MVLKVLQWIWIFILVGGVQGNHFPSVGRIRLDPFRSMSSASSSASSGASSGGAVSSAWSAAGSGIRRFPGFVSMPGRRRSSQRGAGRGNVFVISPMRSPTRGVSRGRAPLFIVGGASGRRSNIAGRSHMGGVPPGVQFIGGSGRTQLGRRSPILEVLGQGRLGSAPAYPRSVSSPMLYVDGANLGSISGLGHPVMIPNEPSGPFALDATAVGAQIPGTSNKLTIKGQTTTGDLILSGPGGTITIGAEVLNGISRIGRGGMRMTEFEELEIEPELPRINGSRGLKLTSSNGRSLVLQGKQTLLPGNTFPSATVNHVSTHTGGGGNAIVLGGASSSSSSSSASAGATAQAGTVHAASSASANSNAIVLDNQISTNTNANANANAGGASSAASSGSSITVLSGSGGSNRVLQLGQKEGKTQVITMGGSSGMQIGSGGSDIALSPNATIVIDG